MTRIQLALWVSTLMAGWTLGGPLLYAESLEDSAERFNRDDRFVTVARCLITGMTTTTDLKVVVKVRGCRGETEQGAFEIPKDSVAREALHTMVERAMMNRSRIDLHAFRNEKGPHMIQIINIEPPDQRG